MPLPLIYKTGQYGHEITTAAHTAFSRTVPWHIYERLGNCVTEAGVRMLSKMRHLAPNLGGIPHVIRVEVTYVLASGSLAADFSRGTGSRTGRESLH
jgi:hypothetical protein